MKGPSSGWKSIIARGAGPDFANPTNRYGGPLGEPVPMTPDVVQAQVRSRVSDAIRVEAEGRDRFRVFTPFRFADGDHPAIVLKRRGTGWVFSDEGNTIMRLTYDLAPKNVDTGTRGEIIANAVREFGLERIEGGGLVAPVEAEDYGNALFGLVQAILRVSDVSLWTRDSFARED